MRHGTTRDLAVAALFLILPASATTPSRADAPQAHAGLPDDRLGVRTAPVLLLSRADVRLDLGMTEPQAAAAELAVADLYQRAASLRGRTGEEALAGRKAVDEAQRQWVETHLTAEQRDRLAQIDIQWEGPSALVSRAVVREALGLSPEQQATIRKAVERRVAAGRAEGAESTLTKETLAALTDEQRERWKAMLGRPFIPVLKDAQSVTRRDEAPRESR